MKKILLCFIMICAAFSIKAQEISPYLVGTNYWMDLDNKPEVMAKVAASGMTTLRIGGNRYNNINNGPAYFEPMVNEAKEMDMEPVLQVPARGGNAAAAQNAAAIVKYFNVDTDNRVQLWAIGNEPVYKNEFTDQELHDYIVAIATAMKEVDNTITIFVPDFAYINNVVLEKLTNGGPLDVAGLKLPGTDIYLVDGFTWHSYPLSGNAYTRSAVVNLVKNNIKGRATTWVETLAEADERHNRTGDHQLKWGIGEFNVNVSMKESAYGEEYKTVEGIGTNSFLNGQFFAEIFNLSMQLEATYATSWSIHESSGSRSPGDLGLFDGNPAEANGRSSFYHSEMVAKNIYGTYLPVTSNQENVTSFGAVHPDHSFSIIVLNKEESTPYHFALGLEGDQDLPGEEPLKMTADVGVEKTFQGHIAPQATMVYNFSSTGELENKIIYSLAHALNYEAPTYLDKGEHYGIENVQLLINEGIKCIDTEVAFTAYIPLPYDELHWDFGEEATIVSGAGTPEVSVSFSTAGAKTVALSLTYNGVTTTTNWDDLLEVASCEQRPYQGNKQQVPGTIKMVHYDEGGQGVAYFDTTPNENRGQGGIRNDEGVDTGDGEDGEGHIGYLEQGEWVEYTLDVQKSGNYTIKMKYAKASGNGAISLHFDGEDKTGIITPANTAGWQEFGIMTFENAIVLTEGESVMRLFVEQGGVNISQLIFEEEGVLNAVGAHVEKKTSITVYPNPVRNTVYVQQVVPEKLGYEIYNIAGSKISNGTLSAVLSEIPVNHIKAGLYLIRLSNGKEVVSSLFIKE